MAHLTPESNLLSKEVHKQLINFSSKTTAFLDNLTHVVRGEGGEVRNPAMPLTAFKGPKGFAVRRGLKIGFLLGSYQKEMGFVTCRLVKPDSTVTFSPPLFVGATTVGIGLSIGKLREGSCVALLNEEAVKAEEHGGFGVNVDGTFLVDMNGARIREIILDSAMVDDSVRSERKGGMVARYFRLKAMLVNLTLQFKSYGPLKSLNRELYGDASAQQILAGQVATNADWSDGWCTEMQNVLKKLTGFTNEAANLQQMGRTLAHSTSRSHRPPVVMEDPL